MSRPLPNVSEAHYMLLQEEHQREMSSETHILPQSATLYNTSSNNHHSLGEQESLGLLGRTDGFRGNGFGNRGGKTNGYNNNGSSNGPNNSYNITDNSNYPYNGGFHKTTTSRRQFFCDHCKMTGHIVQRCYKIHGYPPGHKLHKVKRLAASVSQEQDGGSWLEESQYTTHNQDPAMSLPTLSSKQYQQLLTLLKKQHTEGTNSSNTANGTGFLAGKHFSFLTSFAKGDWIIDSGASDHITPDLRNFTSVQRLQIPGFITMPNGKQSRIEHIGSVQLTPVLTLSNVLHVPEFQFNLLSVHKLCEQIAGKVIFSSSDCTLRGPMLQEVVLGKASSGLYHIHHQPTFKAAAENGSLVLNSDVSQETPVLLRKNIVFSELDS